MKICNGETISFKVPAARTGWQVRIYEPNPALLKWNANALAQFEVPVYVMDDVIPMELARKLICKRSYTTSKDALLPIVAWARNNKRPEVICNELSALVHELQRLDARNLPRDRVFDDHELTCTAVIAPLPDLYGLRERYPHAEHVLYLKTVSFTL